MIGIIQLRLESTQPRVAQPDHAVEAAIRAAEQIVRADEELRLAVTRKIEEAKYEASLPLDDMRRLTPPQKRLVTRDLEARWNMP